MLPGLYPFVLTAAGCAVAAVVAVTVACLARSAALQAAMVIVALLFLVPAGYLLVVLNPGLIDARFRAYRAFYRDIEVGMTRHQVLAKLELRYPTNGPRKRPVLMNETSTSLGFFMDPEHSREPNCEGIFLTLTHGRVATKIYSPD